MTNTKKPRDFWIETVELKSEHGVKCHEVTEVHQDSPFYIHVREVLPDDPRDKALKVAVTAMKNELKAMGESGCSCGAEEPLGEGYQGVTCYLHDALDQLEKLGVKV